jgi:proton-translocating NADH-quinone oxidoreductase chain N
MCNETLLLTAVFAPTAGAFVLPLVAAWPRLRNALAVMLVCLAFACSLGLVPVVASGTTVSAGHWPQFGVPAAFVADGLAVFVACVSSLVSAIVLFYSLGYIRHYDHQGEYYLMVVLFLGAMMGLVFAANLIPLYVFWEITAIASWRLIGFFREPQHVLRADKAFLITGFGAVAMLLGFISIYAQAGSADLAALKNTALPGLTVGLILMGILSKSATLPFHTWLPDAGVAPSPVTALLHAAVLVKIGVYVFARLFLMTFPMGEFWETAVLVIAGASALVSACAALVDTDLKRIIAYSTVSQIAFIFLGLASGSVIGVAGGLLYILMHGLAKGGLFLCAGIVEQNTHTKDITRLGGLLKTMPITAVSFLFCAFSVMGIPPFGGFFSKYMVISGGVDGGHLWITMTFVLGAILTILYLLRVFARVFLGNPQAPAAEGSPIMVFSVALLAGLSLAGGLLVGPPSQFLVTVIQHMPRFVR